MKNLFLALLYLLVAFLYLAIFDLGSEAYTRWYTGRSDELNILYEVGAYLIGFSIYLWSRYFTRAYIIVVLVSIGYLSMILHHTTSFFIDFVHLGINLLNLGITGILYVYIVIFFYFFGIYSTAFIKLDDRFVSGGKIEVGNLDGSSTQILEIKKERSTLYLTGIW